MDSEGSAHKALGKKLISILYLLRLPKPALARKVSVTLKISLSDWMRVLGVLSNAALGGVWHEVDEGSPHPGYSRSLISTAM
eukprot:283275-Amphidinium_carterae.1